ncbi:MAG: hypothetical protein QY322_04740 [bacterium]|nr:MAG: hypothetical protein QY322_04740 [bacterium]
MSLTNEDITKIGKAIKTIVRLEMGNENKNLRSSLIAEVKMSRIQILSTISELESRIKNIEANQSEDRKVLLSLYKEAKKLRKDLTKTIDFFDRSNLSTREKVNKTRRELGLQEISFAY